MRKIFCLIILLFVGGAFLFFTKQNNSDNIRPYIYPIQPGTKEWSELENLDEMIDSTTIPKKILEEMDTASLVETCISHPLMIDPAAFNNYQLWFEALLSKTMHEMN
ncbi:hypothetical protein [uncultured Traorella sp.]|uniref:hypothetical protein n=1 Tax=uncultured Traorella sp. TaxID=1929048 RepID=UPI0025DA2882|nr:hypothetical protein [uncultured Traorella sp.]